MRVRVDGELTFENGEEDRGRRGEEGVAAGLLKTVASELLKREDLKSLRFTLLRE